MTGAAPRGALSPGLERNGAGAFSSPSHLLAAGPRRCRLFGCSANINLGGLSCSSAAGEAQREAVRSAVSYFYRFAERHIDGETSAVSSAADVEAPRRRLSRP